MFKYEQTDLQISQTGTFNECWPSEVYDTDFSNWHVIKQFDKADKKKCYFLFENMERFQSYNKVIMVVKA